MEKGQFDAMPPISNAGPSRPMLAISTYFSHLTKLNTYKAFSKPYLNHSGQRRVTPASVSILDFQTKICAHIASRSSLFYHK